MTQHEIDEGAEYIGYKHAFALTLSNTDCARIESLPIASCAGYVTAENIVALVDSPTNDVSLKDGFAVKSCDVTDASSQHPVKLRVVGSVFAGAIFEGKISEGQAVKICSGSPVPAGAEAIVSAEFCEEMPSEVYIRATAAAGRNVFRAGEDVKAGTVIVEKGKVLLPARLGLIAAAGISQLKVYHKPKVALIAIGDEVIAPGQKLKEGQLYASNLVNIGAWLSCFNVPYETTITVDNEEAIQSELLKSLPGVDVIVTSGGAWGSERDLIVKVLDSLGWERLFHHVRMGPGKGIAFGIWKDKPVFCLPGGPPSNEMAFLQLALPGILHMAGQTGSPLFTVSARLTQDLKGRHQAWTEFKQAILAPDEDDNYSVTPLFEESRLKSMADSTCMLCKPEGVESLHCGQIVTVQMMVPTFAGLSMVDM
ncbi:gephyrin-like molybdotransferase Glp [Chloroflexota bacterium]